MRFWQVIRQSKSGGESPNAKHIGRWGIFWVQKYTWTAFHARPVHPQSKYSTRSNLLHRRKKDVPRFNYKAREQCRKILHPLSSLRHVIHTCTENSKTKYKSTQRDVHFKPPLEQPTHRYVVDVDDNIDSAQITVAAQAVTNNMYVLLRSVGNGNVRYEYGW